jgi:hypothetical protein
MGTGREETALEGRALPSRRPDRAWGGVSIGAHCAVCRTPVRHGEHEFEIDFLRDDDDFGQDTYHLHVGCYWTWASGWVLDAKKG